MLFGEWCYISLNCCSTDRISVRVSSITSFILSANTRAYVVHQSDYDTCNFLYQRGTWKYDAYIIYNYNIVIHLVIHYI